MISGLELWNYGPRWEVFSRFARSGVEVHYVSPYEGVCTGNLFTHKVDTPLFEKMSGRLFLWFWFGVFSFGKGLKIALQKRPTVIYGYEVYGAPPAFFLSRLLRLPLILRFQGTILYPRLGSSSLIPFFYHVFAFKIPANFLVITDDGTQGDLVAKSLRIPEKKVRFWMNGVDKNVHPTVSPQDLKMSLEVPETSKIIISVCRLAGWKGVDRLIEAVPGVVDKRKDVFFVLVGEGSERNYLERLAEKLGVTDHVRFVGHVPHRDVPSYLAIADVYVTMQDLSCLSASLFEAMASGKCIVALNTGGTGKILRNRVNSVLLEPSQLSVLPEVLLDLLEKEEYRRKLERKVKEYAMQKFWTWDERANAEMRMLEELSVGAER